MVYYCGDEQCGARRGARYPFAARGDGTGIVFDLIGELLPNTLIIFVVSFSNILIELQIVLPLSIVKDTTLSLPSSRNEVFWLTWDLR